MIRIVWSGGHGRGHRVHVQLLQSRPMSNWFETEWLLYCYIQFILANHNEIRLQIKYLPAPAAHKLSKRANDRSMPFSVFCFPLFFVFIFFCARWPVALTLVMALMNIHHAGPLIRAPMPVAGEPGPLYVTESSLFYVFGMRLHAIL